MVIGRFEAFINIQIWKNPIQKKSHTLLVTKQNDDPLKNTANAQYKHFLQRSDLTSNFFCSIRTSQVKLNLEKQHSRIFLSKKNLVWPPV